MHGWIEYEVIKKEIMPPLIFSRVFFHKTGETARENYHGGAREQKKFNKKCRKKKTVKLDSLSQHLK